MGYILVNGDPILLHQKNIVTAFHVTSLLFQVHLLLLMNTSMQYYQIVMMLLG